MGKVMTNNEIRISEINDRIADNMDVIKHCKTKEGAELIQTHINELEEEKAELEAIEAEVCPECGGYETEWGEDADDLSCRDGYHDNQEPNTALSLLAESDPAAAKASWSYMDEEEREAFEKYCDETDAAGEDNFKGFMYLIR